MMIVAVCGSPRSRNTEFMLKRALESAKGQKEIVLLKDKKILHCTGCSECQKTGECVVKDGMKGVLQILERADAILLGSPTYFDNVTGLMKDFIDRTHPLYKDLKLKGKKLGIVACGGGGINSIRHAAEALQRFGDIYEMKIAGTVMANEEHLKDHAVLEELKKLGEALSG